ncbi:MAG: HtaA domain-containing protein [Microbacterium sp.]|uniref:HtaA domain-containing protein n=1 Tax=Microbacterium sp. TaxID=51671 RepID=UPI00262EBFE9|nr:HtaA domain-containing protein [Microbacterium sp.]MCX6501398.1 HtaA domain-containing protein [Microbacterium sp.]
MSRGRTALAVLLSLLLIAAGSLTATPANADPGPTLTVSKTSGLNPAGETVTVTGSGYNPAQAMYLSTCTDVPLSEVSFGFISAGCTTGAKLINPNPTRDTQVKLNADGTFTTSFTVTPKTGSTAIYTIADHTAQADRSQDAKVTVTFATTPAVTQHPVAASVQEGATATFTAAASATPAADVRWQSSTNGSDWADIADATSASYTTAALALSDSGTSYRAVFTNVAGSVTTDAAVLTVTAVPTPVVVPTLTVSKTTGLNPAGETVTVTGSGYNPAQAMYLTTCTDVALSEVSFAFISAGCTTGAKLINPTPTRPTQVKLNADGTFETTLTVTPKTGSTAIYTIADHTAQADRSQDAKATITFAAAPAVTTSVSGATALTGLSVTVTGSDLGAVTGAYVALIEKGTDSSVTSSGGYAAMTYATGITAGSLTTTLVAPPGKLDRTAQYEVIVWKEHSLPSASTIYARADVSVTADQWNQIFPEVTPPVLVPEQPVVVAGGSLSWAISRAFTSYVVGDIARGAIAVSGGATSSGNVFQFGQAAGSTFDGTTGTVSYVGSVRFTGHNGVLDVTIANPQIRFTSATSASLYVTSGGRQVEFATLNIGAGARNEANGATTFANVPTSLTSAGLNQVLSGYATTLDPITFTIGAAAAAPTGSTGTIATAAAVTPARAIPSTPPATTGITVDEPTLAALASGTRTTVTASGFQPNEQDIAIVVYSTPILLDTVDADANGVATWTGVLPATLEDGVHTLTFQGSVNRGIQFTLDRAAALAAGGQCLVTAATLNWGFKESFRTYIEGIAQGGWELTDIVYEYPEYVWSAGTGSLDLATATGLVTYGGALTFSGHDGALNTTLANARVELAGDTGYLVFDVSGTTQAGEAVDQRDVRLVEFALPALTVGDDGTIALDELSTTLTEAGSAAFGTYPSGEEMDPVSIGLVAAPDCGVMTTQGEEAETAVTPISAEVEPDAGAPVWPWIVGIIVLIAAAIIVTIIVIRRRTTPTDQA